ncbi:hypothetical protein [Piscinibacter sp.]|uniref:hypothetical protein n=1 Tax=Piscinibacter sp. TaxID=1903157 RepID=UPI002ED3F924
METMLFQRQWPLYWTEEERGEFAAYIAEQPTVGDVVPESGGIRKVLGVAQVQASPVACE